MNLLRLPLTRLQRRSLGAMVANDARRISRGREEGAKANENAGEGACKARMDAWAG